MADKDSDKSGASKNLKKSDADKTSVDAAVTQKQNIVKDGAGQKLQQASLLSGLSDFANHAVEQVGRLRNDAVLAVAGYKPSDIVANLPRDVVKTLALGKRIADARAENPLLALTPTQSEQLSKYRQYHDKIVNEGLNQSGLSPVVIDHKAMIAELNDLIAVRYKNDHPPEEPSAAYPTPVDQVHAADLRKSGEGLSAPDAYREPGSGVNAKLNAPGSQADIPRQPSQKTDLAEHSGISLVNSKNLDSGNLRSDSKNAPAARSAHTEQLTVADSRISFKDEPHSLSGLATPADQIEKRGANDLDANKSNPGEGSISSKETPSDVRRSGGQNSSIREPGISARPETSRNTSRSSNNISEGVLKFPTDSVLKPTAQPISGTSDHTNMRPSSVSAVPIYSDLDKTATKPVVTSNYHSAVSSQVTFKIDNLAQLSHGIEPSRGLSDTIRETRTQNSTPADKLVSTQTNKLAERTTVTQNSGRSESNPAKTYFQLDSQLRNSPLIRKIESNIELSMAGRLKAPDMVRALLLGAFHQHSDEKVYLALRSNLTSSVQARGEQTTKSLTESVVAQNRKAGTSQQFPSRQTVERNESNKRTANFSLSQKPTVNAHRDGAPSGPRAIAGAAESISENATKTAMTFRAIGEPKRHVLGAEIALTVILASAGIQRVRAEQTKRNGAQTAERPDEPSKQARVAVTKTAAEHVQDRLSGIKIASRVEHSMSPDNLHSDSKNRSKGDPDRIALIASYMHNATERRTTFTVSGSKPIPIQQTLSGSNRARQPEARPSAPETRKSAENRHTFGTEIALAALLASGGISRYKSERVERLPVGSDQQAKLDRIQSERSGSLQSATGGQVKDSETDAERAVSHSSRAEINPQIFENLLSRLKNQLSQTEPLRAQLDALVRGLFLAPVPVFVGAGIESAYPTHWTSRDDKTAETKQSHDDEPTQLKLQRPTVLVAKEDTLISIAETFFHDPNVAWLIANLNRGQTSQIELDGKLVVSLMTRQKLILPVFHPDIESYYAHGTEERPTEQLVTVVEESQIDRELMSAVLGVVVGETRKANRREKTQIDTKSSKENDDLQLVFED